MFPLTHSNKQKLLQLSYPDNLIMTLLDGKVESIEVTTDMQVGLEYTLLSLTDVEREVLKFRFKDRLTYAQIGSIRMRAPNGARGIESNAFRKLRRYPIIGYILYGKEGFAKRGYIFHWPSASSWQAKDLPASTVLTIPLKDLDLTIRTYNHLCRTGYKFVGEIANLSYEQIIAIPHLPLKTCKEIAWKLFYMGLQETAWQHFLYRAEE